MNAVNIPKKIAEILLLIIFFMASGCEKNQQDLEKINPGVPFQGEIGTTYKIKNGLTFSIKSIKDYRCPRDVYCIWGGAVELRFNIKHDDLQIDTLIFAYSRPIVLEGYEWEVTEVDPWLSTGQQINPDEYRIKVLISKHIIIPM